MTHRQNAARSIDSHTLAEIIRRVVETADPVRIVLFGSAAAGRMGPNSDVDLLVIVPTSDRLELAGRIYRNLHGVGAAVDVIVATPGDVEKYGHSHALVIAPALKHGKVVYDATQKAAR